MEYIKQNDYELAIGTSNVSEVQLIPSQLIKTFGNPMSSDEYKVSGEYVFKSATSDEVFTLYDWKYTTLYDEGAEYTPNELWKLEKPIWFNIGGNSYSGDFETWIKKEINKSA
jgi:hypothetical protein